MQRELDLYAKVESMIGFDEAYDKLYELYLKKIKEYPVKSLLDVGCGNGNFLLKLKDRYEAFGIDLSLEMVKVATNKGVNAKQLDIENVDQTYDLAVAIGDVLNYIKPNEIDKFCKNINRVIKSGGYFICDLNTLYGFEDVTSGTLVVDRDDEFMSIDAEFFEGVLESKIVYFKQDKECYKKESGVIFQYYYDENDLLDLLDMRLVEKDDISMFSDESDKTIFIFQKS